jgi:hypothetical protein
MHRNLLQYPRIENCLMVSGLLVVGLAIIKCHLKFVLVRQGHVTLNVTILSLVPERV